MVTPASPSAGVQEGISKRTPGMVRRLRSKRIQLVIKITKHCNLRCSYCYEFPYLANTNVMSLDDLTRLIEHVASYEFDDDVPSAGDDGFEFIWHGGEPLMVPIEYYERIGNVQREVFGPFGYLNVLQTNLTILTDRHLDWLRRESFIKRGGLGFSFDVYGNQRLDIHGRDTAKKVLQNLKKLHDNEIPAGAITVLSRSTKGQIENIFGFYDSLGIDFRLLPYHLETDPRQTEENGVSADEIAVAFCKLFDLWRQSKDPVVIQPISDYLEYAVAWMNGRRDAIYDKEVDESIFVIDTNGDVLGYETYSDKHRYGNLFESSFTNILASTSRRTLISRAQERVDAYCSNCVYRGACTTYPVAEANPIEESWLKTSGCYVAKTLAHMVNSMDEAGIGRVPAPTESGMPADHV